MSRSEVIRRLTGALAPVAGPMAGSVLTRLVQMMLDVGMVAGLAWLAVSTASGEVSNPWPGVAVLAAMGIVKAVGRYLEQYLGHYVAFGLLASMRVAFFRAIRPLVPSALGGIGSGDLLDRATSDVDRVEVFYAHTLAPVVTGYLVPGAVVAAMAILVHPTPAWWLLGMVLVAGVAVPAVGARVGERGSAVAAEAGGILAAHVADGIQGLGDVVRFAHGGARLAAMEELADRVHEAERRAATVDGIRSGVFDLVAGAGLVAVAWSGFGLLEAGIVGAGQLAGAVAAALVAFVPLRDVQQVEPAFDRAMAAAARIFAISDVPPVVTDPPVPQPVGDAPKLTMSNVAFAYPGRPAAALEDVTLEMGRGQKVAVVGPTGSGKSTLARLAVRLWDPDRGRIAVGGTDVRQLRLAELRETVTVVPQRAGLVAGTVADNIRLGWPDADDRAVEAAARVAAAHEFITDLPDGYRTEVGDLGERLSGGQRQRIGLARALLGQAPILILDEATSELDVDSEAEVMAGLAGAASDRALLVIAHRLVTVMDADEIVVVDRGRVVERGNHVRLLQAGGLYSRLWARQLDTLP